MLLSLLKKERIKLGPRIVQKKFVLIISPKIVSLIIVLKNLGIIYQK